MAPIATPIDAPQAPAILLKKGVGDYKEQAGGLKEYDPKREEEGEGKAHVDVPCYRIQTSAYTHSINNIFPHGIVNKSFLP